MQVYRHYSFFVLLILVTFFVPINAFSQYPTTVVIKAGDTPNIFTSITPATGGIGGFNYIWQDSTEGSVWTNAPGSNSNLDYQPTSLNDTTYFRRLAINSCGTASSDILTVFTLEAAGALSFDDFDQVVIPNHASLIPDNSSFTIEFWLKTHYNGVSPAFYDVVLGMYDNGSYELAFSASDYLSFSLTDVLSNNQAISSTTPITDDEWHHVAVVRDVANNNLQMYIDGVLENSSSLTVTGAISPTSDLFLGAYYGSYPSKITMDELRIWDKASTASEILDNMKCELDGNEAQLMAYYDFNTGLVNGNNYADTILYDLTSNYNHGYLDDFYLYGDSSNWVEGKDSIGILCSVLNGPLTAIINIDTVISCAGGNNGALSVQALGGTPPYSYIWNNSSTTTSISGLNSRIYSVTVTDAASSFTVQELTLLDPLPITVSENVINSSCNTLADGSIGLSTSGGVGPYTYLWGNNSTSANLNGLMSGTYFYTVIDANNCTFNDSSVVQAGTPYRPQITSSAVSLCSGDTLILSTDTSGINYCWYASPGIQQWQMVGTAGFTTPSMKEHSMSLHPFTNEPYIAYGDNNYGGATSVMKFDGNNWIYVGSPGFTAGSSENQSLAFHPQTGEPYVVFKDSFSSNSTTVMKFNGTSWSVVGSPGISTTSSDYQNIAFNPITHEPYVIFKDNFNGDRTTVMRFNDTTSNWQKVGSVGFSPNSADYQKITFSPLTNEPYVAFSDNGNSGKTLVMRFNGTNWVNVGTSGFSPGSALYLSMSFHPTSGEPYVAFQDKTSSDKTTVMRFNGSNWVYVGAAGFSPGAALYQSLDFHPKSHEPYVAFRDKMNSDKTSVMKYNGSGWSMVGNTGFSPGAAEQQNIDFNLATGEAYVSFLDKFNNDKASVMKFALTCDGTSATYAVTNPGTYFVDVTYSNGCISTSDSIIITSDTTAPIAVTNDIYAYLDLNGQSIITLASINNGSYDDCSIDTMYLSQTTFTCSDLGVNQVILTVIDENNNISTDTAIVTVEDQIPPIISAQPITVYLDSTGNIIVDPIQVDNGSTDNCGILNYILSDSTFDCSDIGLNSVRYTVEDSIYNSSTITVSITVSDSMAPFIYTSPDTFYLNSSGNVSITFADIDNGTIDNCQLDTVMISPNIFTCADTGLQSIGVVATDIYNNSSTSTENIYIIDTIPPTAIAKDTTIYLDANGQSTINRNYINNGSFDNCPYISATIDSSHFDCSEIGLNTVVLTIEDGNGNIGYDTSVVTVIDSTAPTAITNSATIYLNNNGIATLDSSDIDNGSFDNCGIGNFTLSTDTFYCSQAGTQTINYTIVDFNGNITTGTESIIILDTISPVANVKDTTVYLDPNGYVGIDSSFVEVSSYDNCGIATIKLNNYTFNCFDEGVNNVIVTIEDLNGNQTQETVNVTVRDTLRPTIVVKDTTIYLDASGHFVIDSSFIDDGSFDNCQIASISLDSTNFECSEVGLNTVVLTVVDIYGNSSSTTSTVTVIDSISPTAITNSTTVYLNSNGFALIDSSYIDNGSFDICGIHTFNVTPDTLYCPQDTIQVNYILTDVNGNVSTGSETVFILDTISPIANLKDTTVYLDANGSITIDTSFVNVNSTDNCGLTSIGLNKSTFYCVDEGINNITVTLMDHVANTTVENVNVTVLDTLSPVAIAKDTLIYLDINGQFSIDSSFIELGSYDNCAIQSISLDVTSFDCSNVNQTNVVTMTVTDEFQNTGNTTAVVQVIDSFAPVVLTQNINVYLDANGTAAIDSSDVDNGSHDICGIATMALSQYNFDCSHLGPNTVQLTVTDVNQNSSVQNAIVTVLDTIAPVINSCPSNITMNALAGQCGVNVSWTSPTASDNCSPVDSLVSNYSSNSFFPVGTTVITYIAYKGTNTDTCNFTITVLDVENPVISNCPADITVSNDPGDCFASVNWTLPSAIDNCKLDSLVSNFNSGDDFPVGVSQVTYIAYDSSMNTDTCTFNITVVDNEAPQISCMPDTIICDQVFFFNHPSFTDNCLSSVVTITQINGLPSGSTFPIGTTLNTFVAEDSEGNKDTCSFEVTVRDIPSIADAGTDQTICTDTSVLNAVAPVIGTGNWSVLSGNGTFDNPSDPKSVIRGISVGQNEFVWSVSNLGCGMTRDTIVIDRDQLVIGFNAGDDEVLCSEFESELMASPLFFGIGSWSVLTGNSIIADPNEEQTSVTNLSIGENKFMWSISNGTCPIVSDTVTIIVEENPTVNAGNDITIFNGDVAQLNVVTNANSPLYNWYPSFSLNNGSIANPIAKPTETTVYTVEVRTVNDCMGEDEITVIVNQQLEIATGLTPNNDGRNDTWIIKNIHKYPSVEIKVYSRSGQNVFSSTGYEEEWDGKFKGNDLPTDSYYYVIQLNDEENRVFEGTVTIIR